MAETRDADHAKKMKEALQSKYKSISIMGVGEALGLDEDLSSELTDDETEVTETNGLNGGSDNHHIDATVLKAKNFGGLSIPMAASSQRRGSILHVVQSYET